jgi:type IV secretory pathway VirB4 component
MINHVLNVPHPRCVGYPPNTFPDTASALVDAERKAQFEEASTHYESSYFLTFLYLPPAEGTAKAERLLYEGNNRVGRKLWSCRSCLHFAQ